MSHPYTLQSRALERGGHVLFLSASPAVVDRTMTALEDHESGLTLTVASSVDEAFASLASVDCLAVSEDIDGWQLSAVVEAVRERDPTLPVVAVGGADSGDLDALLAAGVTDVVASDAPDALLVARLNAAVGTRRTTDTAHADTTDSDVTEREALRRELDATRESIRDLYTVTTDASLSLDERIERTLELACERLGVHIGFVTRLTDDTQYIVHSVGGHPLLQPGEACPLSESYCRRTLEGDGLLAVVHTAVAEGWENDPGYERFGLESYLGGRICVDDELYGTLCFADTEPRDEPFTESQTAFVELLTRWVRYELERKQRSRELRAATRRFRALFDNPRTFAGILDLDGTLREANDMARSTLKSPDDALGRPFWEAPWWTPDDDAVETVRAAVETAAAGEVAPFECRYFPLDNSGTVGATIYPVYGVPADDSLFDELEATDTEIVSLMAIGTDTTTRTDQAEQLRRQRDRLEEFASVVSHDLRSPLEVARGRLQLYEQTGDEENLEAVQRSIDRMSTLIGNLLGLAREGETVSAPVPTSVAEVAFEAWSTVSTGAATLTTDIDPDVTVDADPTRLRQLFENLFRNSIEHGTGDSRATPDGSVAHGSTDGTDDPLAVRLVAFDDGRPGFAVEDDGVGIDPDDRPHVFDRGFTTDAEGTGFGLAIVGRIVEAHGWEIGVTEGTAGGARFEVCVAPESCDA